MTDRPTAIAGVPTGLRDRVRAATDREGRTGTRRLHTSPTSNESLPAWIDSGGTSV